MKTLGHKIVHSHKVDRFIPPLDRFSLQKREEIMRNYFKFMFVRHPFERLISAYKDKFEFDER